MKTVALRGVGRLWLLVLALSGSVAAAPQRAFAVDEAAQHTIAALFDRADKAVVTKDMYTLEGMYADRAMISLKIAHGGQTTSENFTKEGYFDFVRENWQRAENHRYKRTDTEITADSTKASATFTTHESMEIDGQKLTAVNKNTASLERVDGRWLIVKLQVESTAEQLN